MGLEQLWATKKSVVYFDQLSGAARTRKLFETFFGFIFRRFLLISAVKSLKKL